MNDSIPPPLAADAIKTSFSFGIVQNVLLLIAAALSVVSSRNPEGIRTAGSMTGALTSTLLFGWGLGWVAWKFGNLKAGRRVSTGILILMILASLGTIGTNVENRQKALIMEHASGEMIEDYRRKVAAGEDRAAAGEELRKRTLANLTQSPSEFDRQFARIMQTATTPFIQTQKEWLTVTRAFTQLDEQVVWKGFAEEESSRRYIEAANLAKEHSLRMLKETDAIPAHIRDEAGRAGLSGATHDLKIREAIVGLERTLAVQKRMMTAHANFYQASGTLAKIFFERRNAWRATENNEDYLSEDSAFKEATQPILVEIGTAMREIKKSTEEHDAMMAEIAKKTKH